MTVDRLWIVRFICACFALACLSGIVAAQTRMGLVGPGVGWAVQGQRTGPGPATADHLFWTSDDGGAWNDITPQDPASRQIAGVFFLDASRGWVLLALKREPPKNNQEPDNFITDIRGFDLASTTDGGANWNIKHLDSLPEGVGWLAASEIFFLDISHGWMNIASPIPHWGGAGILLATTDGGNTWKEIVEMNGGGGYGAIRFTDPQNGWITGGTDDKYLYASHDGGRHWAEIQLPVPREVSNLFKSGPVAAQYAPPAFRDTKRGVLCVTHFEPGAEAGEDFRTLTLFSTNDGGLTWHSESSVNLGQDRGLLAFTAVDSQALAPKLSGPSGLTLMKLGLAGKVVETGATEAPQIQTNVGLLSLGFSDVIHGWASLSNSRLFSTIDGGVTWKEITPGRKTTSMLTPSNSSVTGGSSGTPLRSGAVASPISGPIAASSTITSYKSRHIGFDICTLPTTSQMGTWWGSSPYFDYGVYVGGADTRCASVTSSWVKTVTGQGWGLIPIWVGPQAPCTCAPSNPPGIWPNCTNNWASTISTTGGAYAQGQAEADAATKGTRSAMQKLGLGSASPVYFDIENYTPSATCNGNPTGSYVNSFLSGWASEIQQNGYIAAVYGNPTPASTWYAGGTGYAAVSPSPSDVWIANYNNANYNVTIWGLGFTDSAWSQDQRMHQYFGNFTNQNETWGGVGIAVDRDIEDADVTGGNGAKSYSFTYTTLQDFPGATNFTTPAGINNSGEIVGYYLDPATGLQHGYLYDYYGGSFTSIDCANSTQTQAYGINNAGSIVGFYNDQLGTHGFLYQVGFCTGFDYPGATSTYAWGINDDNQISGYYTDSVGGVHGFLYQPGNSTPFTPFDYPLASGTYAYGINGDAQIAGATAEGLTFLYGGGTFSYPPLSCALGVNNNDQITGCQGSNEVFLHEGNSVVILYPGASQMNPIFSSSDFTIDPLGNATAKVAVVGLYYSNVNGFHGFLATSQ